MRGWGPRLAMMLVAIAITTAAVFVGTALADSGASISVAFSNDAKSATISSSKGISHYTVTLCSGGLPKVEVNGEVLELGVGAFDSPITSIEVKAGTTDQTFSSGASCEEEPAEPPVDDHPPAPPADDHPPAPPADDHPPAPPADEHPPTPPVDEHPPTPPHHDDPHPSTPPTDEHPPEQHPSTPPEVPSTPPTTESTPPASEPTPTPPAPPVTPTPPAPQAPFTPPAKPKPKPKPKVKAVFHGCYTLRVSVRQVSVGNRTELRVVVLAGKAPAAGIAVKINGGGLLLTSKTNKRGVARFVVSAKKAGIISVSLPGKRNCAPARIGAVGPFTPPVTG